ncbi:class I adenylate-forming enzyme family protein [Paraburkholderia strydomiana]|uniref:class I adenylate-forming enzyme family protein n=1 Tax=Paraburkholderia strydomiana TaxID=1245417 RepID=UPI001BECE2A7|nr:class I adenylate-forming enzyme family protein [Paraburkholderia strydomiana]MBT2790114.1 acyl--CoA ligase [Paraburkholderia strydomiana]
MTPINALRHQAMLRPEGTAFIHDGRVWTYQNLLVSAEQLASSLVARGVRKGDRVIIHMPNSAEIAIAYFACFRIGAIACPMNLRFKAAELREMFRRLMPAVYLGEAQTFPTVQHIEGELPATECRFVLNLDDRLEGGLPWSILFEAHDAGSLPSEPSADAVAVLLTTSGTTGHPKLVAHTAATLSAIAEAFVHQDFDESEIMLNPAPMVHAAGLSNFLACVNFGAPAVTLDRFEPGIALDLISAYGCTRIGGSPFLFRALIEEQRERPRNISSLQYCIAAGDVCPMQLHAEFKAVMGLPLRSVWGCTEASGSLTFGLEPGPVSRRIPGVDVRLVDDAGRSVSRGEVGELLIKGPNVMVDYWIGPDEMDSAIADGWFHTGDLMRQGERNDLWFTGRKKDIIIRGGSNVSPVEVESVLMRHPMVRDAAVFGLPDPVLGQRVAAVVQLAHGRGDLEFSDILAATRRQLADYKVPERLLSVHTVPRNALGKIDRRTLAAEMAALLDVRSGGGVGVEETRASRGMVQMQSNSC